MLATGKMRSGNGSGDSKKTGWPIKSGDGRKILGSGYRFMPNMSMRKLTRAIETKKDPKAKIRLLAYHLRKKGCSTGKICRELGIPYSTARDWLFECASVD